MRPRPRSVPNYAWPAAWLSGWCAPWRWMAATVFHAARLLGRIASIINLRRASVAIIRTDGAGDAILFEPALSSLHRQIDGCVLDLWAPAGVCRLFESHPRVRRRICVPRGFKPGNRSVFWSIPWRARLGFALGRYAYELAVYPPEDPEPLGSWLMAQIRAREKWMCAGSTLNQHDWQQQWASQYATRILQPRGGGHELQRNAHLAGQWGSAIEDARPQVPHSPRAQTYAGVHLGTARHMVRRARAGGLVGIVPAGSAAVNQYPLEKWAAVVRLLWEEHQLLPALLGGPDDEPFLNQIGRTAGDVPLHRFPTDQDIAVAAAVVSRLDGLISVDTGLAHVAAAADLPAVVLVTGGMPGRFWPWPMATRSIALTKPMPCAGCNYRCTQPGPLCITDLSPQWIVDALLRAMNANHILPQQSKEYRHAG